MRKNPQMLDLPNWSIPLMMQATANIAQITTRILPFRSSVI